MLILSGKHGLGKDYALILMPLRKQKEALL
jgi:hypothetical protein